MLALVGRGFPDRLRVFLLTVSIVEDVIGLIVIATVYTGRLSLWPLLAALVLFAAFTAASRLGVYRGVFYAGFGVAAWGALSASGIDPIVIRPGDRPGYVRDPSSPRRPRTRQRPVPPLPGTAHTRAPTHGAHRAPISHLAE
jgi:hypothetical protein